MALERPSTNSTQIFIDAKMSVIPYQNEIILISIIPTVPSECNVPVPFKRIQFLIKLGFAMTVNKSRGQTFSICGVDLTMPVFSHGMLYVALSRTLNSDHPTICSPRNSIRYGVYREIFK